MKIRIKYICSLSLVILLLFSTCFITESEALSINNNSQYTIEDLGNGFTAESKLVITDTSPLYSIFSTTASKSASVIRTVKKDGAKIATITFTSVFQYNGSSVSITSTSYSKSLASGWTYNNHSIITSGGTATLNAVLKKLPYSVPVNISLTCSPSGVITKN